VGEQRSEDSARGQFRVSFLHIPSLFCSALPALGSGVGLLDKYMEPLVKALVYRRSVDTLILAGGLQSVGMCSLP
jgi:fucose permease